MGNSQHQPTSQPWDSPGCCTAWLQLCYRLVTRANNPETRLGAFFLGMLINPPGGRTRSQIRPFHREISPRNRLQNVSSRKSKYRVCNCAQKNVSSRNSKYRVCIVSAVHRIAYKMCIAMKLDIWDNIKETTYEMMPLTRLNRFQKRHLVSGCSMSKWTRANSSWALNKRTRMFICAKGTRPYGAIRPLFKALSQENIALEALTKCV